MTTIRKGYKKISRNSICLCGSGRKYKYCCLRTLQKEEQAVYMELHYLKRKKREVKKVKLASPKLIHTYKKRLIIP